MNKYDVVIIGGACAGLTAGIYAGRRELKTLILTKDIGGQIALTTEVENYPGTGTIMGPQLAQNFKKQAEKAGAEIKFDEVQSIEKKKDEFIIKTKNSEFQALTIVLAYGLEQRKLDVPGESRLIGKGVAYCATCDGPLFKNKTIAVVGGGNSAFDSADYLADLAEKVYVLVRTDQYRAEEPLINSVQAKKNVQIMNFTEIKEFIGENKLEKVQIINNQTKEESELELDGVFVEIGWKTKTDMIKNLVDLSERGYVITDNQSKTSCSGIFAAGDITDTPFKQAVISAGEGAKAALSAAKYIQQKKGKKIAAVPDLSRKNKENEKKRKK